MALIVWILNLSNNAHTHAYTGTHCRSGERENNIGFTFYMFGIVIYHPIKMVVSQNLYGKITHTHERMHLYLVRCVMATQELFARMLVSLRLVRVCGFVCLYTLHTRTDMHQCIESQHQHTVETNTTIIP